MSARVSDMLPGERVLWRGQPSGRALTHDLMHVRWLVLYFAVVLIWGAASDRSEGLSSGQTLLRGVPLFLVSLVVLAACAGFARACARATTYTITNQRCILRFGLALHATLSLPLRRIATVSVAVAPDSTGNIPLMLHPGSHVSFLKLWPHARPWRFSRPQPMLRGIPEAAHVGNLLSMAISQVSPGRVHPLGADARTPSPLDATSPAMGG